METPVVDVTDVQAVYAQGQDDPQRRTDPLTFARRHGAGMVIRGSYYRSGDSVLFQAEHHRRRHRPRPQVVGPGRYIGRAAPTAALEVLRERVAAGLSPLVNALNRGYPVDPDLVAPPSFPAYREFVAGLGQGRFGDWDAEAEHYRRAARLDSTFVAPLVQLAFRATWNDECAVTDSIGRRARCPPWTV